MVEDGLGQEKEGGGHRPIGSLSCLFFFSSFEFEGERGRPKFIRFGRTGFEFQSHRLSGRLAQATLL